MKILVTGAAGFIGFHLIEKLLTQGHEVVGLDNINDYYAIDLKLARLAESGIFIGEAESYTSVKNPHYKFVKLDLENSLGLQQLFKNEQFDQVCNLAAQAGVRYSLENPQAYINSNIQGFLNILECCRHFPVKHLVYASSSSVYGLNRQQPFSTSDHTDHPVSLYAATKKSNELMAHTYSHLFGIPTTGLRFFTVYGPWGRPDMAPFLFADAIVNERPLKVFNYGEMARDFTYIDDIVEGIIRVLAQPSQRNLQWDSTNPTPDSSSAPYRIFNIGNNQPEKLLDFIELLEQAFGKTAHKEFLPMQAGDVEKTWAETSDLEKEFGYLPNTSLSSGIVQFVKWYKKYYQV